MSKISGSKFEQARKAAGVTRVHLAEVSRMSYTRIWQIGTDEVSNVGDFETEAMCKKMKIQPADLAP